MDNDVITVCVTGAAGQIAYSLLPLLCNGSVFGEGRGVKLQLLEITPMMKQLEGVVMEIEDAAYPLVKHVVKTDDPVVAFRNVDVAILVGAFPRRAGMERKDLLAKNVPIFKAQGEVLNKVAARGVKVLLVGNPANTNALVLSRFAPDIPVENVSALTRLDHNRTVAQVAKQLDVSVNQVEDVCIWGNHSSTQYPDVTQTTIKGELIVDRLGGLQQVASKLIPTIQKRGAAVIQARGFSSAMSAASAIGDHLRSWLLGDDRVVSMAVCSDGSYGVKKGLFFSFPVRCAGNGQYEIVQGRQVDEFSQRYLDVTTAELMAERDEALAILS